MGVQVPHSDSEWVQALFVTGRYWQAEVSLDHVARSEEHLAKAVHVHGTCCSQALSVPSSWVWCRCAASVLCSEPGPATGSSSGCASPENDLCKARSQVTSGLNSAAAPAKAIRWIKVQKERRNSLAERVGYFRCWREMSFSETVYEPSSVALFLQQGQPRPGGCSHAISSLLSLWNLQGPKSLIRFGLYFFNVLLSLSQFKYIFHRRSLFINVLFLAPLL